MRNRPSTRTRRGKGRSQGESTVYRGPVILPAGALDMRITSANMTTVTPASTTAGGVLVSFWPNSGVTGCTDWVSFANVYAEYRVVGMRLTWQNINNQTYDSARTSAIGAVGVYHYPITTNPASVDEVIQNANYKLWSSNAPLSIEWKARGTEEMAWIATTATSNHGGFRMYATGGTASVPFGSYYVTYLVQFRGRV